MLALVLVPVVVALLLSRRASRARCRRAVTALRLGLARQMAAQQRYADRHELSGLETAAATRTLRWKDGVLAGDLLPTDG